MGFFDFGLGDKREKVKAIRDKQRKVALADNRADKEFARQDKKRELLKKKLEAKERRAVAEARVYRAQAERREAKREASWLPKISLKTPKLKKKRQGKRLSSKRRITLL
ncbi:hypothetical protein LCGC14_0341400 [marine sediment metagenome]|uniref:Uncharacterized protein n=1 Tax=marine sediment metagenome TaxID=412755 RepID=A0A0F9WLC4_9ZZZZ